MNRYVNITPSAYDPMSMQEIMMAPLTKRKQHDETMAAYSALNPVVDPLDVHNEQALAEKAKLQEKINQQIEVLQKEGYGKNTSANILNLNREYQDAVGPTGTIGQINQAKKLYDAERARFLESASKQYGSDRALQLWEKHKQDYTGYVDPEKSKIKYIDSKGIAAVQNFDEDLKLYNSLLGETTTSAARAGYSIQDSGLGDGSKIMVNSSGQTVNSDNINQLNEQRKLLSKKWIDSSGEGYKYNDEAGIDLNNFNARFNSSIDMQRKTSNISKSDVSANFIEGGASNDEENDVSSEGVAYDTKEIGTATEEFEELDNIGKPVGAKIENVQGSNFSPVDVGSSEVSTQISEGKKTFKYSDIKNPILKERYLLTYKQLLKDNKLKKEYRNPDNPVTAKYIKEQMQKAGPITLSSKVIKSDMKLNSLGFPGELSSKDINQRSASVEADVKAGTRQALDPETGREMKWDDFNKKYPGAKLQYYGYSSPHNWDDNKWGNPSQNVASNKVIVSYKDGDDEKTFTTSVSRTDKELSTRDFQASKTLNKTYKKATLLPNHFVPLETTNPRLKGIEVKFNNSQKNLETYGVPTFDLNIGGNIIPMSEQEYIEFVYKEYNK